MELVKNQRSTNLSLGDIVFHYKHGKGQVVNIIKDPEFPMEVLFKNSQNLRIKVPVTLYFTISGKEVSMGKSEVLEVLGNSQIAI